MTTKFEIVAAHGAVVDIPLNRLKASPRNVRKVPHSGGEIEARAASIAAKGLLQPLVVEPERNESGEANGFWLVTIGEGRRLALCLRAKRKEIGKTCPVRCIVDVENDPSEISLDENISRTDMHPADQFEAFRDLAERRDWGPEEIGARFGVSAHVVRQRLRLGAVSPKLLAIYREDGLNLDQLMAFAVSEDHARQEQVFEALTWNRGPAQIRRAMTEAKVSADDRRAVFVGVEAYVEAGGAVLRDLFTEDRGGWLEDATLLDRLTAEKLAGLAENVRAAEGWKWAQAHMDYPSGHSLTRVYPHQIERTEAERAEIAVTAEAYDALLTQWAEVEDLPPEIEAWFAEMDAKLQAWGDGSGFDPEEVARGGVFAVLGYDGEVRFERGFVRHEDLPPPEAHPEAEPVAGEAGGAGDDPGADAGEGEEAEPDGLTPLSAALVADLAAHRTAGLRDALADHPEAALLGVIHAIALRAFYPGANATCLGVRFASRPLGGDAEGIEDGPAYRRIVERHETWARQLPREADDLWAFVVGLDSYSRMALFAHCVGLTADAVPNWQRGAPSVGHADVLASVIGLDMTGYWRPTARSYLGRVTKARIAEAVREAVSGEAAERIATLKKPDMAAAAEQLLAGTGWLPEPLRTAPVDEPESGENQDQPEEVVAAA